MPAYTRVTARISAVIVIEVLTTNRDTAIAEVRREIRDTLGGGFVASIEGHEYAFNSVIIDNVDTY